MKDELLNIVTHLEKNGFLRKDAGIFGKSKLDKKVEDARKAMLKRHPGSLYGKRKSRNGTTEYYDPKAPKGQEWSNATPEHREQFRANEKANLEYKRRERVDDTIAGFFMDAQNPENRWANYVLPWIPIFRGAGLVSKGKAALIAGRAAAARGGTSGVVKGLVEAGSQKLQPVRSYLNGLYNLGWREGGKKGLMDFIKFKGPMIPEGIAAQGAYAGGRNLPGTLGYWRPEGTEDMSAFQYALHGMPVYTQFNNGPKGPLGLSEPGGLPRSYRGYRRLFM